MEGGGGGGNNFGMLMLGGGGRGYMSIVPYSLVVRRI